MERTVSRTCFFPRPNVTSALMTLTPSDDEENKRIASDPIFHRFLIGLMQYRRKTLANALKQSGVRREDLPSLLEVFLREQGLIAEVRAEQLTPSQLRILYHLIYLSEKA
ncbi:MAG: 16S rRNA (adenine(1518)-N(6)/adenine(1519)-N(6))-dimethyltransferase, partial [Clostridiaceae bacterium]|nr:16S rRNA (adenine(1518)-N(6)/adenine(1519)-N(6))-dimethyltransferase [Clostridiaceae bacterium]